MSKIKNYTNEEIFGDLENFIIRTNSPEEIKEGANIRIVNSNCEFEYDSINNSFDDELYHAFVVDINIIKTDVEDYVPSKSNNGGCYAFADAVIMKVKERGY